MSESVNSETEANKAEFILPIILDGTFFSVTKTDKEGKHIAAKCQVCKTEKIINGGLTTTTNFLTHLKRKHPSSVPEYENRKKDLGPALKKKKAEAGVQSNSSNNQRTLISSGFLVEPTKKQKVTRTDQLVLNFIVKGMHPLRTIEEPGFEEMIKGIAPSVNIVSRRTLGRQITEESNAMKARLNFQLKEVKFVCMTADAWTCKGMSRAFLGATVHWIDSDMRRISAVLACTRFRGTHSYDKIAELLSSIIESYGIALPKITKVVTDNGSNFVKAFEEFGDDGSEENDTDSELDSSDKPSECDSFVDLEFTNLDQTLENPTNEQISIFHLPSHQRCASHTLSLICTKDVENVKNKYQTSSFAKCYGLWNKTSRSAKCTEKVKNICGKLLIKPCPTRWNSLYDSISNLLSIQDKLSELCDSLDIPKFSKQELEYLFEYKKCVKPIAQGLDRLQGDRNCYYGELLPTLLTIQSKLVALDSGELTYCKILVGKLLEGLRRRFIAYIELDSSVSDCVVSAVSHPYFKLRWAPDGKSSQIREMFIEKTYSLFSQQECSVVNPETSTSKSVKQKKLDDDFFAFSPQSSEIRESQSMENNIRVQCNQYLADNREDIGMLQQYPDVKNVFIKYNTTLPSSGPVERLFNYAGMILSPKRRSLSDETFEKMLLLKENMANNC